MIGIYDYTVILTYLSVCSTVIGMFVAFNGRPLLAVVCLMVSGLCDGFDGKVARTKKRDAEAIGFGIQIDSLADVMAYGILPVVIGYAIGMDKWYYLPVACLFVLGALIRLAHFNVHEEELAKTKGGRTKTFIGLPTTSVALILPVVYSVKVFCGETFPIVYAGALLTIAFLFVAKVSFINKPDWKRLIMYIVLGFLELVAIMVLFKLWTATR